MNRQQATVRAMSALVQVACRGVLIVAAAAAVLQGYALVTGVTEGASATPAWFGNRAASTTALASLPADGGYRFLAVGDTKCSGTWEDCMEKLPSIEPTFAVLLGDMTGMGSETEHAFLRAELQEMDAPCPVFCVPGNHDVDPHAFPLSRFQDFYGPARMKFAVGPDLFILLPLFLDNQDGGRQAEHAARFLEQTLASRRDSYRHVFLFCHSPVGIYPGWERPDWPAYVRLAESIRHYRVTACFAGHLHQYSRSEVEGTDYLVSGGGGGHLREADGVGGFFHAVVVDVTPEAVHYGILPLRKRRDVEDKLEGAVFAHLWPLMNQKPAEVIALNLVLFGVVVLTLRRRGHRTNHSDRGRALAGN